MTAIGYVREIDGLRAIAVLAVLFYHAGGFVPAGLYGVDIFFVISGFVVAASVIPKRFSGFGDFLCHFYLRRILRIVPALLATVLATTLFVVLFVPRAWLSDTILETGRAALFGLSNLVLYRTANDYFSPRADYNPFMHTWSLGVEEQFYLLFPLLVLLVGLCRRSGASTFALWTIGALLLASLVLCWQIARSDPIFAFYMLPTRFWELAAGLLVYLALPQLLGLMRRLPRRAGAALSWSGPAMIALALFPGPMLWGDGLLPGAAIAAIGTAITLPAVLARPGSRLNGLLGAAPAVAIGRVSYSLYLWHWPVFVAMRWTVGLQTPLQIAAGIAASVLLSVLSHRFIETPFRRLGPIGGRRRPAAIAAGIGGAALVLAAVDALGTRQPELSLSRTLDAEIWTAYDGLADLPDRCALAETRSWTGGAPDITFAPIDCAKPGRGRTLYVLGDSHAQAYLRMLRGFAATTGTTVRTFTHPGCSAPINPKPMPEGCAAFLEAALSVISKGGADDIAFLPALRLPRFSDQPGEPLPPPPPLSSEARAARLAKGEALLAPLRARGMTLVFESPLPLFRRAPFRCSDWFNRMNPVCVPDGDVLERATFDRLRAPALADIETLAAGGRGTIWDPARILCDAAFCRSWRNGKPLFFDGDHLSGYGNDILLPDFRAAMLAAMGLHDPGRRP